ncbi:MAG: MarR family transcriptional regulator, partial [Bacteroidetes bacterium]
MENSPFNLDIQNSNTESRIVAALERISQAFRILLWNESKDFSLTPIQIQVLIFLLNHSEEKRTVTYLAREFNITKATISDTIKTLTQKELISKEYHQEDTRSYFIHLTPKGREIAQKTSLFTHELFTPLEKLNLQEKENFLLNLISIIHHLQKAGIISLQRMCFTCVHYRPNHPKGEH